VKCIGEKCLEYYEGTFRFYCRLMGYPVNLESNCLISKYIQREKDRLADLFKLEDIISELKILRDCNEEKI